MIHLYIWWHGAILAHRVSGRSHARDNRGEFYVIKCTCGKRWQA